MVKYPREDPRTALPQLEKSIEMVRRDILGIDEEVEKRLATNKVQHGTTESTSVASGSYVDISVTFSKPFESVPTVVCSLVSTSASADIGSISATVYSVAETGFTCRLFNNSANSRTPAVSWIATDA